MAKKTEFLQISVKAATITGAVIGFLGGLATVASEALLRRSLGSYGVAGRVFNTTNATGYTMVHASTGFGLLSIVIGLVGGAICGAIIALVYNWATSLK